MTFRGCPADLSLEEEEVLRMFRSLVIIQDVMDIVKAPHLPHCLGPAGIAGYLAYYFVQFFPDAGSPLCRSPLG